MFARRTARIGAMALLAGVIFLLFVVGLPLLPPSVMEGFAGDGIEVREPEIVTRLIAWSLPAASFAAYVLMALGLALLALSFITWLYWKVMGSWHAKRLTAKVHGEGRPHGCRSGGPREATHHLDPQEEQSPVNSDDSRGAGLSIHRCSPAFFISPPLTHHRKTGTIAH